jgi:hypothetical protein
MKVHGSAACYVFFAFCLTVGCGAEADRPNTGETGRLGTIESNQASGSSDDSGERDRQRGRGSLLQSSLLRSLSAAEVRDNLSSAGFDETEVRYGTDLYRVVYATIDPEGQPLTASGLVALPRGCDQDLKLVSFAHGTEIFKEDAPSTSEDGWVTGPALTYASAGFAAVAPDYLGLGVGPGTHPWMHLPTETSASLDLLRAARSFARLHGVTLGRSVFVTGFSQGSFAALGLARALAQRADGRFRLAGLSPISGPYQWTAWVRAAATGAIAPKAAMIYLAYLSVAYDRVFGLYEKPSEFFLSPYDAFIEDLFDGTHPGSEVVQRTPGSPAELFTPSALARFADPDPPFARALGQVDAVCTGWSTHAPTQLFAASGDEEVPFSNSQHCASELRASGVHARLVDLGDVDHLGSNRLAAVRVLRFFMEVAE